MAITAISLPFWVVPVRQALGFNVNQYTKVMDKKREFER